MTERLEPSVGSITIPAAEHSILAGLSIFKSVKSPERIVEEALAAFTKAQGNLEVAAQAINAQVLDHEQVIKDRQEKLEVATESRNRLARIADRFSDLLK